MEKPVLKKLMPEKKLIIGERGAVTVEAAIALCAVVVVLVLGIGAVGALSSYLRCTDAAREVARLTARGDRPRAEQALAQLAPAGAQLAIRTQGDEITVEVTAGAVSWLLPEIRLHAIAYALAEPGALDEKDNNSAEQIDTSEQNVDSERDASQSAGSIP